MAEITGAGGSMDSFLETLEGVEGQIKNLKASDEAQGKLTKRLEQISQKHGEDSVKVLTEIKKIIDKGQDMTADEISMIKDMIRGAKTEADYSVMQEDIKKMSDFLNPKKNLDKMKNKAQMAMEKMGQFAKDFSSGQLLKQAAGSLWKGFKIMGKETWKNIAQNAKTWAKYGLKYLVAGIKAFGQMGLYALAIAALIALFDPSGAFIDAIVDVIGGLIPVILDLANTLIKMIPGLVKRIASVLTKLITMLVPALLDAVKVLLPALGNIIKLLAVSFIDLFGMAISLIANQLPSILATVIDVIVMLATDVIPTILQKLGDMLPGILNVIINALLKGVTQLIKALPQIIKALLKAAVGFVSAIIKALPMLIKSIVTAIPDIINAIVELIPFLIETIVELLPELITALVEAIPAIIVALVKAVPQIVMALVRAVPTIIVALAKAIPEILTVLGKGLMDLFKGIFTGLFPGKSPEEKARIQAEKQEKKREKQLERMEKKKERQIQRELAKKQREEFVAGLKAGFSGLSKPGGVKNAVSSALTGVDDFMRKSPIGEMWIALFGDTARGDTKDGVVTKFMKKVKKTINGMMGIFKPEGALGKMVSFFDKLKKAFFDFITSIVSFFDLVADRGILNVGKDIGAGMVKGLDVADFTEASRLRAVSGVELNFADIAQKIAVGKIDEDALRQVSQETGIDLASLLDMQFKKGTSKSAKVDAILAQMATVIEGNQDKINRSANIKKYNKTFDWSEKAKSQE
jgi:phage-related protein